MCAMRIRRLCLISPPVAVANFAIWCDSPPFGGAKSNGISHSAMAAALRFTPAEVREWF